MPDLLTPEQIEQLVAGLRKEAGHEDAENPWPEDFDGGGFSRQCADAIEQLRADRDALRELVRHSIEEYEVLDLSDETFDKIEKRAHALWDVVKERDALRLEVAAKDAEIDRVKQIEFPKRLDIVCATWRERADTAEAILADTQSALSNTRAALLVANEEIGRLKEANDDLLAGHIARDKVVAEVGPQLDRMQATILALRAENDALRRDAERYRLWRDSHAAGLRPFLPARMPATTQTAWGYPGEFNPPDDEWMRSTPAQRAAMIDQYIDAAALANRPAEP